MRRYFSGSKEAKIPKVIFNIKTRTFDIKNLYTMEI